MPVLFGRCKYFLACGLPTFLLLFLIAQIGEAIPRRANEPWSVILCKFAELPMYEPRSKEWVEKWIFGQDGLSSSFFRLIYINIY
jgi:hypothetical protein